MAQFFTNPVTISQVFGDFIDTLPPEHDSLELTFTPSSRPIKQRWRNNRLSAHFVADYFTNFLPVDENNSDHERRIKESKAAVSYVANELLENAIKFNDETVHYKVRFGIHFLEQTDEVIAAIFAVNSVKPEEVDRLKAFINGLLSIEPGEFYIQQIEKSVEEDKTSGLGLLTMMNDYSAKVGWKLETIQSDRPVVIVTTMAQVSV